MGNDKAGLGVKRGDAQMGQNHDKETHITTFVGKGSVKRAQYTNERVRTLRDTRTFSVLRKEDKYLGNYIEANGRTSTNTENRIKAIREGFYAFQKF